MLLLAEYFLNQAYKKTFYVICNTVLRRTVTNDMYSSKKLILFDLDGTLAESKSVMDDEMTELLGKLLAVKKVAVISGGRFEQFKVEFLEGLASGNFNITSLYLFPTCATSFYRYEKGDWVNVYQERFSSHEKRKIMNAFAYAMKRSEIAQPIRIYGDVLEDRESQITYSAAGQKAPVLVKRSWDPDAAKRLTMKRVLEEKIPEFEIRVGGMTSIDVTRKGIDKAYGIRQIETTLGIGKEDMLFIGDALFPGGNDYPVREAGVECIAVVGPHETKEIIQRLLFSQKRAREMHCDVE